MPISDFLFQGSPPPSVVNYNQSQTQLPGWLDAYSQAIAARATDAAAQPLQQPNFARIAGLTPDQQAAFDQTRGTVQRSEGLIDQAAGAQGASAAAQPYLARAGQSAADTVGSYMSPYTRGVTDEIARLGARNLHENLLPGVNDTFTKAGMFGGTRNNEFTSRAIRDTQDAVLGAQSGALERGYASALGAAGADTDRAARAGQLAAQTADADRARLLSTAATASGVGQAGAGALSAIGAQQQAQDQANINVALQDFLEARGYPREQVNFLTSAIRGVPYSQSSSSTSTGPGSNFQPSLFSNLAGAGLTVASLARAFPGAASGVSDWVSGLFGGGDAAGIIPFKRGGEVRGGEEMLGPDEGPLEGERLRRFIENHGIDMRRLRERAFPGPIARKGYRDGGPVRPPKRGALSAT